MKVLIPKISNLNLNLGKIIKSEQEIHVKLNANISYSEGNVDNYLITEILNMFSDDKTKILSIEVVCPVTFEEKDIQEKKQREDFIKKQIFPKIYKKIKEVSDYILANATIALPPLPENFI